MQAKDLGLCPSNMYTMKKMIYVNVICTVYWGNGIKLMARGMYSYNQASNTEAVGQIHINRLQTASMMPLLKKRVEILCLVLESTIPTILTVWQVTPILINIAKHLYLVIRDGHLNLLFVHHQWTQQTLSHLFRHIDGHIMRLIYTSFIE